MSVEYARTWLASRNALDALQRRPTGENVRTYLDALADHIETDRATRPPHWTDEL